MTLVSLAELLRNPALTAPPPIVARPFAVAGRTVLLTVGPKRGKTTTALGMIAEASRDGVPCALWQLDEALADTVQKLIRFGATPELVFVSDQFDAEALDTELLAARGIQLYVLDHLGKLAERDPDFGPGSAGDAVLWGRLLAPFTALARDLDMAVILLDQARRSDGKYSGSTAKAGSPDLVIELTEKDGGLSGTPLGRIALPPFRVDLGEDGVPVFTTEATTAESLPPASASDGKGRDLLLLLSDAEPEGLSSAGWLKLSGLPQTSYHRYRRALLRDGLVLSPADTRSRRYRVTDKGENTLEVPQCHGTTMAPRGSSANGANTQVVVCGTLATTPENDATESEHDLRVALEGGA